MVDVHHAGEYSQVPVATSELIGALFEAVGYGIYLMVTPRVLNVLIRKKHMGKAQRIYFLTTTVLLFVFATVHIFVDLTRAMVAFTSQMSVPNYAERYFANVNTGWNISKNASYTSATIVADTLLVYRTFIVWGRNYWIALVPTLILMADFSLSVWFTWSINEAHPGNSVLVSAVFVRSKYFLIATLVLNLLCTLLISVRIWRIQRLVTPFKASRGANAISIIVESAALYSAVTVVLIVCSILNISPFFFFLNSMPPLIGVVFSYIIIRSSSDDRNKYGTAVFSTMTGSTAAETHATSPRSVNAPGVTSFSQGEGVHIHLEQVVRRDEINPRGGKIFRSDDSYEGDKIRDMA
jgi:hypothetical protein